MKLEIYVINYSENIYIQLRTISIPLYLESHGLYDFTILIIIIPLYHFYIEHEIYHKAYNKVRNCLNDHIFIEGTMINWGDNITFSEVLSNNIY